MDPKGKKEKEGDKDTAGPSKRNVGVSFTSPSEEFHSFDEADGESPKIEVPETERSQYQPVAHHWFYRLDQDGKNVWKPFSKVDSTALEKAYNSPEMDDIIVATDGGRYDVNLLERKRFPVYWDGKPTSVRRSSWFYKGTTDAKYVPYAETIADRLEEEYRSGSTSGVWHCRIPLPSGESVVLHGPTLMVHLQQPTSADTWGNTPQTATRPRVVRRGVGDMEIEEGESTSVDHLLMFVHGIGAVCDLKCRTIEDVVDEFRSISLQLLRSHYKNSCEKGLASRIEVLPVAWHSKLHSEETGIDRQMNLITLDSISKLRRFSNDTVLDVLFYTSPVFCQTIVSSVALEMNRLYNLFAKRNPAYKGGVSLAGHSLGSLIMFDLLYHQKPTGNPEKEKTLKQTDEQCSSSEHRQLSKSANVNQATEPIHPPLTRTGSSYVVGTAGTGQPYITYPRMDFNPKALFALGSPIGIFECVRGIDTLGEDFALPTCPAFFNIFHPHDPVAYRIEPLINPELAKVRPELIPHHKGRKRMHLELKDTMARVGADIKARVVESITSTWAHIWKGPQPPPQQLETVVEDQLGSIKEDFEGSTSASENVQEDSIPSPCVGLGRLNAGRRVDHVLQEAPIEMFNEYLSAITSHCCYWDSEDTVLLILREIYGNLNVQPDSRVPQQTLTVEVERTVKDARDENTVSSMPTEITEHTNRDVTLQSKTP